MSLSTETSTCIPDKFLLIDSNKLFTFLELSICVSCILDSPEVTPNNTLFVSKEIKS